MRPLEVEEWALRVIETVKAAGSLEDARVELKSDWQKPEKAARRVAGHANAARGEPILWLFGVTDIGDTPGVAAAEFASWWAGVQACFDGPVPRPVERNVYVQSAVVVAVAFTTEEAPYVVRNPQYGQPGGGPVEFEVPWREMTAVRSARHSDLIRILAPISRLPEVEVLSGSLSLAGDYEPATGRVREPSVGAGCRWNLRLELYVVPVQEGSLVLPVHRMRVTVEEPGGLGEAVFRPYQRSSLPGPVSVPVIVSTADYILEGPSRLDFTADYAQESLIGIPGPEAKVTIRLLPAGADRAVIIHCSMTRNRDWGYVLKSSSVTMT